MNIIYRNDPWSFVETAEQTRSKIRWSLFDRNGGRTKEILEGVSKRVNEGLRGFIKGWVSHEGWRKRLVILDTCTFEERIETTWKGIFLFDIHKASFDFPIEGETFFLLKIVKIFLDGNPSTRTLSRVEKITKIKIIIKFGIITE